MYLSPKISIYNQLLKIYDYSFKTVLFQECLALKYSECHNTILQEESFCRSSLAGLYPM